MYMDQEDMSDSGLTLTLGYGGNRPSINQHPRQEPSSAFSNPTPLEPSLTLSLSDDADGSKKSARVSSPHSTVSSFSAAYPLSVKTEKDLAAEDHEEHERVPSSRISDDEDEGNARKKLRLTKEQSVLLEERFKEHSTLNPRQKQALARQLNLRPRQVEVWFQNRRARTKLKQTEVDCEFLKRCCQTLSDENRRLQKELHELRALKFAPATPLYMQIPAASLTMCPSCERIGGGGGDGPKGGAPKPHFFNPFAHPAAC